MLQRPTRSESTQRSPGRAKAAYLRLVKDHPISEGIRGINPPWQSGPYELMGGEFDPSRSGSMETIELCRHCRTGRF